MQHERKPFITMYVTSVEKTGKAVSTLEGSWHGPSALSLYSKSHWIDFA